MEITPNRHDLIQLIPDLLEDDGYLTAEEIAAELEEPILLIRATLYRLQDYNIIHRAPENRWGINR